MSATQGTWYARGESPHGIGGEIGRVMGGGIIRFKLINKEMKTLGLRMTWMPSGSFVERLMLLVVVLLTWYTAPILFELPQGNSTEIAKSIGLMLMLSLAAFTVVIGLCWWLLQRIVMVLELPLIGDMVLRFNELDLWDQVRVYVCLFVLLVSGLVGCMLAVL